MSVDDSARPGALVTFDESIRPRSIGAGRYQVSLDPSWWVDVGPNGGYLAAVLTRASELEAAQLGVDHRPASISVHYLRAPGVGPAEVQTRLIRTGRTTTVLAVDLIRNAADVLVTALITLVAPAADGGPSPAPATVWQPPTAPAVHETPVQSLYAGNAPTYLDHWELRPLRGHLPFRAPRQELTEPLEVSGWIRLREDRPVDASLLATMADAWAPVVFGVLDKPMLVPTLSFNLMWRAGPAATARWCLVALRTEASAGGLADERVTIHSESGELLLQGQQLAQLRPADRRVPKNGPPCG